MLDRDEIYNNIFSFNDFYTTKKDTSKPLYLKKVSLFCKELRQLNQNSQLMTDMLINQFMYKLDSDIQFTVDEVIELNIQFLRNKIIYNLILTKVVNDQPKQFIHNMLEYIIDEN